MRFVIKMMVVIITPVIVFAQDAQIQTIKNNELGFSFLLPAEYIEFDPLIAHTDPRTRSFVDKNSLYAFNKGGNPEANNWSGIFVEVELSDTGLLQQSPPDLGPNVVVEQSEWRGCTINTYREEKRYTTKGDMMILTNTAIPLEGNPIQIKMRYDSSDRVEAEITHDSILQTFNGELDCESKNGFSGFIIFVALAFVGFLGLRRFLSS